MLPAILFLVPSAISSQSAYVFMSSCEAGDWKWEVNDVFHSLLTDEFARCEESSACWKIQSCKSRPACVEEGAKPQDMSRFFILGLCDFSLFSIMTNQINPIRLALVEIKLEKCWNHSGHYRKVTFTSRATWYAVDHIYFGVWVGRERSWPHILVSLMACPPPHLITHSWEEICTFPI